MSDETYNGWANRETWAFWLHVTNDEGWYNSVREYVIDLESSESDSYDATAVGEHVVDYVRETLDEPDDDTSGIWMSPQTRERVEEERRQRQMMRDEIGSWWRIDHAEIGAAARELASDQ